MKNSHRKEINNKINTVTKDKQLGKKRKKSHSEERKEPYNTLNGKMKREKKKHSNAKEPYKSGKKQQPRNSH